MKLSITLASIIVLVAAAPVEVRDPQPVRDRIDLDRGGFATGEYYNGVDLPPSNQGEFFSGTQRPSYDRGDFADEESTDEELYPNDFTLGRRKTAVIS
ncbi:uncharacterized protein G6M90_00g050750 [Metarhizium brunneum]|uniref:Uncharacterized protein n=1 Tax=Metarhizium brunneum TaxID=500148 RepID=A0A7D5Z6C5_9HYPO